MRSAGFEPERGRCVDDPAHLQPRHGLPRPRAQLPLRQPRNCSALAGAAAGGLENGKLFFKLTNCPGPRGSAGEPEKVPRDRVSVTGEGSPAAKHIIGRQLKARLRWSLPRS